MLPQLALCWLRRGQSFFLIDLAQANESPLFSFITFTNLVVVQLNVHLAFPVREFPCFAKVNQIRKLFVITVLTLSSPLCPGAVTWLVTWAALLLLGLSWLSLTATGSSVRPQRCWLTFECGPCQWPLNWTTDWLLD